MDLSWLCFIILCDYDVVWEFFYKSEGLFWLFKNKNKGSSFLDYSIGSEPL